MWDVTAGVCGTWYILNGEESVGNIPSRWNSKIFILVPYSYVVSEVAGAGFGATILPANFAKVSDVTLLIRDV